MNAKKKLLGGMPLNGQAIPVGGITPTSMPKLSQENFGMVYPLQFVELRGLSP
jgi:hypothetical protein